MSELCIYQKTLFISCGLFIPFLFSRQLIKSKRKFTARYITRAKEKQTAGT